MIPPGHIILVISRGDKIIYKKEGVLITNEPYVRILTEED